MGQDWKTLSLVVVVAAIAGWWVVRALGGRNAEPVVRPTAVASPAPAPTEEPVAAAETPVATPAAVAKPGDIPVVVNEEAEVAAIQRDLDLLRQALARDQRIEELALPRVNDALDVPGVTSYRRAPAFWESALGEPKEDDQ